MVDVAGRREVGPSPEFNMNTFEREFTTLVGKYQGQVSENYFSRHGD